MKLWLIRHAKSSWTATGGADFERPLNPRGERDGPRMAAWLARQDHPATWVWTSDAVRARATATFVVDGFAAARPTLVPDHRLYAATPEQLLDVIRETPPDQQCGAMVAHNPGLTQLANLLAGEQITDNLPTFGVVRFQVSSPWATLALGSAEVELLMSPKVLP